MSTTVLGGSVRSLVGTAEWHGHNLAVYESAVQELVVMDDAAILQIMALDTGERPVCALNEDTGAIAVATAKSLRIYECIELFGQEPRWERTIESATDWAVSGLAWLGPKQLGIAMSEGHVSRWDLQEQRSVWMEPVGHRKLSSTGSRLLSYDPDSPVIIVFKGAASPEPLHLGPHRASKAFFVAPDYVAADCGSVTFLWQEKQSGKFELIASVPDCLSIINVPQIRGPLIQTLQGICTLDADLPSDLRGTLASATSSRIYTLDGPILRIYNEKHEPVASVSGPTASKATSISTKGSLILAGASLLASDLTELWTGGPDVVQSTLAGDRVWTATAHALYVYVQNRLVREQKLPDFPLAMCALGDYVLVVTKNAILKYDQDAQLVRTTELSFLVQSTAHSTKMVAVYGYGHLELVFADDQSASQDIANVTNLSAYGDRLALATSTEVSVWTAQLERVCELEIDAVDSIALTEDALAVLSGPSLKIYALVARVDLQLVLISEAAFGPVPLENSTLFWSTAARLAAFNGRQLVFADLELTPTSRQALENFGLGPVTSLADLVSALQRPLPVYHPEVLLFILKALKPELVTRILGRLADRVLFADRGDDDRLVILDPALGCASLASFGKAPPEFSIDFARRLMGLTSSEQTTLQNFAETVKQLRDLDGYAACARVLGQVFDRQDEAWAYAWLSTTKSALAAQWETPGFDVWLDRSALVEQMETHARKEYAATRDPPGVTLYYLALHKIDVLKTIWRISGGHPEQAKTVKLLQNDFTTPRWRSAAQKNAYALLSRRRFLYAAAFFLLGDSVADCCQIILGKTHDLALAVAVARVYDGDHSRGLATLVDRVEDRPWTSFFLRSVLGRPAVRELPVRLSTLFLYAQQGGTFGAAEKTKWTALLAAAGIPALVFPLVTELEPVDQPKEEEQPEEPEEPGPEDSGAEEPEEAKASSDVGDPEWKPPAHLKPAPEIPLEPDMSAFGF